MPNQWKRWEEVGVDETEPNIRNKLARGKVTAVFHPMLSRHWRAIVVACGILGAVHGSAQASVINVANPPDKARIAINASTPRSQAHSGTQNSNQPPSDARRVHRPSAVIKNASQSHAAKNGSNNSSEREERDVIAQESMAKSAKVMNRLTRRQLIVGGLGIVAIVVTIVLSIRANIISREVGRAQVRAYMSCSKGRYSIEDDSIYAHVWIANSGQSPALGVGISGALKILDARTADWDRGAFSSGESERSHWPAGHGEEHTLF